MDSRNNGAGSPNKEADDPNKRTAPSAPSSVLKLSADNRIKGTDNPNNGPNYMCRRTFSAPSSMARFDVEAVGSCGEYRIVP